MNRNLCICLDFLTNAHKARIQTAAESAGFTPHFFTTNQLEQAAACLQHCRSALRQLPQASAPGSEHPAVVLLFQCRRGPLLCRPHPLRQPRLHADQLQRLRRHHLRACDYGHADAAAENAGI